MFCGLQLYHGFLSVAEAVTETVTETEAVRIVLVILIQALTPHHHTPQKRSGPHVL